jgi:ABC-type lipoprotein release transport system permease subunit
MIKTSLKTSWFLANRQLRRTSKWSHVLIISVMMLTFLNLVFVSGILVGLIEGSTKLVREYYSGDVLVKNLVSEDYIIDSDQLVRTALSLEGVEGVTSRYIGDGIIQAGYRERTNPYEPIDSTGVRFAGIDPVIEDDVMGISRFMMDGDFLEDGDDRFVVLGSNLIRENLSIPEAERFTVSGVEVGDKIRILAGDVSKEYTVKGIIGGKIDALSLKVFMTKNEAEDILNRKQKEVNEIAMKIDYSKTSPDEIVATLKNLGFEDKAEILSWEDSLGTFFEDITRTFSLLGNMIGSIALVVAAITTFIVIFINAITRRRYIGIMKGIGISKITIELAYVWQSMIYAIIGSSAGVAITFGLLKPYFDRNPIDFPFSDGILAVSIEGTVVRLLLLFITTVIAGYVPARMITKENTLNSILGR